MNTTCLLIDDEKLARELLMEYLESFPEIEVIGECAKGSEAVEKINKLKPDLIFLDVQMPEVDGFEATRQIRAGAAPTRDVPIIALTAKAMKDDQVRCLEVGASDYIAKPLDVDMLLSLLRVWMPKR